MILEILIMILEIVINEYISSYGNIIVIPDDGTNSNCLMVGAVIRNAKRLQHPRQRCQLEQFLFSLQH